jgi:hypothetical protein
LVVLAVDDAGVTDPSYTGTVRFSSTDALATLPADYSFTIADSGRKLLSGAVLRSLGAQRITGTDISDGVAPGSVGLSVFEIGSCSPSATTLCLNEGRFQLDARWRRSTDLVSTTATAIALTPDTGYFWFFGSSNIEVVTKVLNACHVNGSTWVFAAGLTNVEVFLTVVDTDTGAVQAYENPAGTAFVPVQDTVAFPCP